MREAHVSGGGAGLRRAGGVRAGRQQRARAARTPAPARADKRCVSEDLPRLERSLALGGLRAQLQQRLESGGAVELGGVVEEVSGHADAAGQADVQRRGALLGEDGADCGGVVGFDGGYEAVGVGRGGAPAAEGGRRGPPSRPPC